MSDLLPITYDAPAQPAHSFGLMPATHWVESGEPLRFLPSGVVIRPHNYGLESSFSTWTEAWDAAKNDITTKKSGERQDISDLPVAVPITSYAFDRNVNGDLRVEAQTETTGRALQAFALMEPLNVEASIATKLLATITSPESVSSIGEAVCYLEGEIAKTGTSGWIHAGAQWASADVQNMYRDVAESRDTACWATRGYSAGATSTGWGPRWWPPARRWAGEARSRSTPRSSTPATNSYRWSSARSSSASRRSSPPRRSPPRRKENAVPAGINVLIENGFATLDFVDTSIRGTSLAALVTHTPAGLIEKMTRSGPRVQYRVPEGNARAAGLVDGSTSVSSMPDRDDLQFAQKLVDADPNAAGADQGWHQMIPTVAEDARVAGRDGAQARIEGPLRPNRPTVTATPDTTWPMSRLREWCHEHNIKILASDDTKAKVLAKIDAAG